MGAVSYTLNRRVMLQRPTEQRDEWGQRLPDIWDDVTPVWADIRHAGGLETVKAGAETSIVKASIRIRYRADLDTSMRVLYGEVAYHIKAILPDVVAKRHVDLVCEVAA